MNIRSFLSGIRSSVSPLLKLLGHLPSVGIESAPRFAAVNPLNPGDWWTWDGMYARARTKSEARAAFKTMRGLKRLPVGANVRRELDTAS